MKMQKPKRISDTNFILSSSVKSHDVHVYSSESGELIENLAGHKSGIWKLHVHDKERFFSGGRDKRIVEWNYDADEGKFVNSAEYMGHTDWLRDITSLNDKLIASCGDDTHLKIWDIKTHWCTHTFRVHSDKTSLTCIKTIGNESSQSNVGVVLGSEGGNIHHYDVKVQKLKATWKAHDNCITGIEYSDRKKKLLFSCEQFSDVIKIWDARLPFKTPCNPVGELFSHTNEIWDLHIQDKFIYTASQDGTLKQWDFNCKNKRTWDNAHESYCVYCIGSCGQDVIISGGDDNRIVKWNVKTGKKLLSIESKFKVHDVVAF